MTDSLWFQRRLLETEAASNWWWTEGYAHGTAHRYDLVECRELYGALLKLRGERKAVVTYRQFLRGIRAGNKAKETT